ncbi:TonB-linked SusC/RagA family outer membrane protein [Rhabdobacter roseus]|uniref:TonB-linked SusC/RagA family outer membrane protein n=1 Tax=Rhabdobacter roseus TaxID=1655419 RepID=A0A840TLU9_9BACT|nr:TonB-dependent receptor [Rhabdobacter roseus]MBB5284561.1 TonB-linked SusC/RagA family outer membrane protein [Rhabdobacter roseus]
MRISCVQLLLALVGTLVVYANDGMGQSVLSQKVALQVQSVSLRDALVQLEKATDVKFIYSSRVVKSDVKVSVNAQSEALSKVLDQLLSPIDIGYRVVDQQILLYKVKPTDKPTPSLPAPATGQLPLAPADILVRGQVVDGASSSPLPGVSVVVRGTSRGTTTNAEGRFELEVPDANTVLVFSFVGFEKLEVPVGNRTELTVELAQDIRNLEEMVVVGYGTVRKSDLTGSVSAIKGDKLLDRQATNVAQALQGRLPGVDVSVNSSAPGYQPRIRIRGVGSINSSLDPLYVVDGIIGVTNANLLNPNDIESVEVLKDASATAIYGARGANGVIIITTKRGKSGQTQVSYDAWSSYITPAKYLGTLSAEEFMSVYNTAFDNAAKYDPQGFADGKYVRNNPADFPNLFDANGRPLYNTDWEREIYRPAMAQNHELGVRGGSERTAYSMSLGYTDQGGLMRNSNFKRYSAKLTLDNDVNKWLKLGGSLFLNRSIQQEVDDASGGLNVPRMVMEGLPILPIKYPDGSWGRNKDWPGMEGGENPVRLTEERERRNTKNMTLGQVYSVLTFNPALSLRSNFSFELKDEKNNFYSGRDLNALSADQKGVADIWSNSEQYWQFENYLNYNKTLGNDHVISALGGLSWQKRYYENFFAAAENFIDDFWGWHNLGVGTTLRKPASGDGQWTLNSYFARINYIFREKYLFTVTGRYDGSSKFGVNNKYAFFPSAAVAWNISQEEFLKNSTFITNLRLRASYGKTGNQEIGQFASQQFLSTGDVLLDGQRQTGIWRGSFGNPDLRWEYTNQLDIGADIGLWNNRLELTVDYYHKVTKDLLLNAPIPWSTGLGSVTQNIGSVENKGFELGLNSRNIATNNFNWTTNVAFSTNQNRILKLGVNDDDIFPGPWFLGQTNILRVGYPIGSFWGYRRLGTWGTDEADQAARYNRLPGDLKWADLNEDGRIDAADETIIGRAYPKWTMNIGNTIQLGKFDFSVDIRFVMGVNTVNATKHSVEDRQAIASSSRTVLNAWTPENQNTHIAQIRHYNAGYDTHMDDWWTEDGSFIRGQNIMLGYTLPSTLGKVNFQRLRVYVSAQNFFLISKYSGYDPEALTGFGNQLTQNMEFFQYPRPRTFNAGLNVSF